jgi:release factor glutamine methyltransferase
VIARFADQNPWVGKIRRTAVRDLAAQLQSAGVEMPALEAQFLVCAAIGIDRRALRRDDHLLLGATAARRLSGLIARRLAHEPLSRILGSAEFHGLTLAIDPAVLDPRSDTETLVNTVLEAAQPSGAVWRILDLGTGSGAILCALLADLPNAFGVGVDKSAAAAAVARSNLMRLGLNHRAVIAVGDWAAAIGQRFDIVVANPPYIERAVISTLAPEVREFDPSLALDGGNDGLDAYRLIIADLVRLLRENAWVAFEVGFQQARQVAELVAAIGIEVVRVARDLGGHERVVLGHIAKMTWR